MHRFEPNPGPRYSSYVYSNLPHMFIQGLSAKKETVWGEGGKQLMVEWGQNRRFLRCWPCRRFLRCHFEPTAAERLQRRLEFISTYQNRFVCKLSTRSGSIWRRKAGQRGWEQNVPLATLSLYHTVSSLFAQVRWFEHLQFNPLISQKLDNIVKFIQT